MNSASARRPKDLIATVTVVAGLHVVGLVLLGYGLAAGPAGALTTGMAAVAYGLGLRHAADADHIAMIDNSTRKFVADGKRHASVGLAFSAGHSTVVVAAGVAVVAGAAWIHAALEPGSRSAWVLGVIGGTVAGLYLLLIAASNLPQIAAAVRALRDDTAVEPPNGLSARLLRAPLSKVTHPAHIYGFGLLFGLGFDTASSVSVLMLTATATVGVAGVPVGMLALPVMFAAAMTLGDTVNALVMLRMYTAAVSQRRRAWFNLVITGISVVSAVTIAVITLSGVVTDDLGLRIPGAGGVAGVDTEWWGIGLIALFLAVGLVALLVSLSSHRHTHRPAA